MTAVHDRPHAQEAAPNEAPYTLDKPAPRVLSFWDQSAFWANLGVSLFAFTGAYTLLAPDADGALHLPVTAGIVAMIVGTVIGGLMMGLAALPGARTGQPAMVLLRGLFGARLSYLPTALNILQMIGWGIFELIVIAGAARELYDGIPRWAYVIAAGLATTALTLWPLGSVRVLRRYVTVAVAFALVYFYIQLLREGVPDLGVAPGSGEKSWGGFWLGADAALAVSISFVPLAADYTRHARSARGAFGAASGAYALTQIIAYTLGLFALAMVAGDSTKIYEPFLAVPLGALFFAVFVLREADQSFANVYSTAVSIQNIAPRVDRRVLTVGLGAVVTLLALKLDMNDYYNFLLLIASVFVPMLGVLAADFFLGLGRRGWDTSRRAPSRWGMIAAWATGFVTYQMINPGQVDWWSGFWTDVRDAVNFTPESWMSASLFSFAAAALAVFGVTLVRERISRTTCD